MSRDELLEDTSGLVLECTLMAAVDGLLVRDGGSLLRADLICCRVLGRELGADGGFAFGIAFLLDNEGAVSCNESSDDDGLGFRLNCDDCIPECNDGLFFASA